MGNLKDKLKNLYEKNYKLLLIIPFLILVLSIVQIGIQYSVTGDFVNKGISLKGGSTITVNQEFSEQELINLEAALNEQFPLAEISIRKLSSAGQMIGVAIDSDAQDNEEINALSEAVEELANVSADDYTIEVMGSSLGASFFQQTKWVLLIAFILMGAVVFIYFRTVVPALAIILAAVSDLVVTLAIFNLTGMKLGTSGIAAFLMLIGYSVDTDILLSSRLLKKKEGTISSRIYDAMNTGLTMSATSISVVLIAFLLVKSEVVKQIMLILLIGLFVDLIMTWIQNVGVLRSWLERKNKKKHESKS
ncbi:MAG: protein translocase subunit SecF [archaeon]|nr:protein translocase subunit SecF [Nanoarchaeota archaeon]